MERSITLERGRIDLETGEFPLTLMTNGEASDGHIVDIRTLVVGDMLPMFFNHDADPTRRAGQMNSFRKSGKTTRLGGASLKGIGRIDLDGDSEIADIRRDVAQGIHVGDVTQLSGRWDGGTETARAALPKGHYAFSEIPGGWQTPTFFEGSTMLEGSIVGLGADPGALAGRSGDLSKPQHVRDFYRALAAGGVERPTIEPVPDDAYPRDWEAIETSDGVRVFVPREIALVWGQSVNSDEFGPVEITEDPDPVKLEQLEQLRRLASKTDAELDADLQQVALKVWAEMEDKAIQPEASSSVDTERATGAVPELGALGSGLLKGALDDIEAFHRERETFRDARMKEKVAKFYFDTYGVIPDAC